MQSFKTFVNESSVGRVFQHTQGRNIGMITAHRGEFTAEENVRRNKQLEGDLRSSGYGFIHVKGRYIENHGTPQARPVDEHSYLVVGKQGHDNGHLHQVLTNLGKKYGQDSVLVKKHDSEEAHLHGTKEGGWPGLGNTHSVGTFHPSRAGEFHSVLRNKKTFAFESAEAQDSDFVCESVKFVSPVGFFNRQETEF